MNDATKFRICLRALLSIKSNIDLDIVNRESVPIQDVVFKVIIDQTLKQVGYDPSNEDDGD